METEVRAPSEELKLDRLTSATETIILCAGRITSDTTSHLQSTVRPLFRENARIVMDLAGVDTLDSCGIGMLVSLWVAARRARSEMKLIHLSERIQKQLRITNLTKVLEEGEEPPIK